MRKFPHPLMSEATAQALELPSLLRLVAELAATDLGRERVRRLQPIRREDELRRRRCLLEEIRPLLAERRLVPGFESSVAELFERL